MTKKKFGKGMADGTSHQPAKNTAATASPQVLQLGASAPSHAELMVPPRVRLSIVTEGLLHLWRSIQGGFVTESLLRLWRSIQGGVGRLIQFFLARRDAGVLHPSAPSHSNTPGGVNPSAASRSNAPEGVNPSAASRPNAPGGDGRAKCRAGWNEFRALHRALAAAADPVEPQPPASPPSSSSPEQPQPQEEQPQAPPDPFLCIAVQSDIGTEYLIVPDEELAQYAVYCQDSAKYTKQVICHLCVFDDQKYYANHFFPNEIVPHCMEKHEKLGMDCKDSGCRVRVSTQRERTLHFEFCHRLASGWWNTEEYEGRLQRHYEAVEKRMRPF
ncbi:hypothetical protein EJB05_35469 [Eragrostis curvula]|uniref:Uncharacterized protein n=1 Tax=Eragrostis curvula TaxID=38414 RepID=A0A5J9U6S8_9POAL|nr:hypothetical protein EJB05_35469 [Eragrostis curvula]